MSKKKQTSKNFLNTLLNQHYQRALEDKAEGKPVVWATSISPQELLETMDLTTVYPENHAAAIGARKEALKFIENAELKGYSSDICSYARVNMGYTDIQCSEALDIPLPDLIFTCSNICNTVLKWYENLAKLYKIPIIAFDMPFNHTYDVPKHSIKYMRSQVDHAILQLEEFTGKKFDYDKLGTVMELSNATCEWWKKATDWAMATPSPLNGFDMFNYMAIIVCMRGNMGGHKLFKMWHDEMKEKARYGKGPWNSAEEKYRIIWDGIACWPHLSVTFKTLKKYGINMVTSTYPESWNIRYEKNDIDGMVKAYASNYANRNLDYDTDNMVKLAQDFAIDGIVYHSNRSCKLMDFRQYEIQRRVGRITGVPSVVFDGDQTDPRNFSEAQYETRIQALVEMMEAGKIKGGIK